MTNPSIPTRPCASCGVPTNETASVHGVMHDACYRADRRESIADHMSGKPMVCATLDAPVPASTLQPHQQRVVAEHAELAARLGKLTAFMKHDFGDKFMSLPLEEQDLLQRQHAAMQAYSDILVERIAGFAGA